MSASEGEMEYLPTPCALPHLDGRRMDFDTEDDDEEEDRCASPPSLANWMDSSEIDMHVDSSELPLESSELPLNSTPISEIEHNDINKTRKRRSDSPHALSDENSDKVKVINEHDELLVTLAGLTERQQLAYLKRLATSKNPKPLNPMPRHQKKSSLPVSASEPGRSSSASKRPKTVTINSDGLSENQDTQNQNPEGRSSPCHRKTSSNSSFIIQPIKNKKENLDKPLPLSRPSCYSTWGKDQQKLWDSLLSNPDQYYYKYCPPTIVKRTSTWSAQETEYFCHLYYTHPPGKQWGLFSLNLAGRTGEQCEQHYQFLKSSGKLDKSILNTFSYSMLLKPLNFTTSVLNDVKMLKPEETDVDKSEKKLKEKTASKNSTLVDDVKKPKADEKLDDDTKEKIKEKNEVKSKEISKKTDFRNTIVVDDVTKVKLGQKMKVYDDAMEKIKEPKESKCREISKHTPPKVESVSETSSAKETLKHVHKSDMKKPKVEENLHDKKTDKPKEKSDNTKVEAQNQIPTKRPIQCPVQPDKSVRAPIPKKIRLQGTERMNENQKEVTLNPSAEIKLSTDSRVIADVIATPKLGATSPETQSVLKMNSPEIQNIGMEKVNLSAFTVPCIVTNTEVVELPGVEYESKDFKISNANMEIDICSPAAGLDTEYVKMLSELRKQHVELNLVSSPQVVCDPNSVSSWISNAAKNPCPQIAIDCYNAAIPIHTQSSPVRKPKSKTFTEFVDNMAREHTYWPYAKEYVDNMQQEMLDGTSEADLHLQRLKEGYEQRLAYLQRIHEEQTFRVYRQYNVKDGYKSHPTYPERVSKRTPEEALRENNTNHNLLLEALNAQFSLDSSMYITPP